MITRAQANNAALRETLKRHYLPRSVRAAVRDFFVKQGEACGIYDRMPELHRELIDAVYRTRNQRFPQF